MRWLAVAHGFLQCIYHATRERRGELVALLLSVPIIHAFDFGFQFPYPLTQRCLRSVRRENLVLSLDYLLIQFDGLRLDLRIRFEADESLRYFARGFETAYGRGNASKIHNSCPGCKDR